MVLLLTGCGVKPYVDTDAKDFATLQLTYKGDVTSGDYITYLRDFSNGCKVSVLLGEVTVDQEHSSRSVKIPVEQPLWISANYVESGFNSSYRDNKMFVLTPEKGKHYVVSYIRKDLDFFNTISDFDFYMLEGEQKVDIPSSRAHVYSEKECK